jgi:hypothetical protein
MHSTPISKPNDDPHDVVVVAPDAVRVAPSEDELSDLLHQAARFRVDTQTGPALPPGPTVPPVDTTFRPAALNDVGIAGERRSVASRAGRAVIPLLLATCAGLAAVGWKSYGDVAIKQFAKLTTQLVLTTSLPSDDSARAAQPAPSAVAADAANPASSAASQATAEAAAPAAVSADSAPSLQSMARDLANLGQEVELLKASLAELKAGQPQASRDVTRSSEARASEAKPPEQNLRPRKPAPAPRVAAAPAHRPMPSPPQPMPPPPPPQASSVPALPPAAAPYPNPAPAPYYASRQSDYAPYAPRPYEPQPPPAGVALTDPELSAVPRPPMPLR